MKKFACGIDIGSMSTEAVLAAGDGSLVSWVEVPTRPNHQETASEVYERLLQAVGLESGQLDIVVGTGYDGVIYLLPAAG